MAMIASLAPSLRTAPRPVGSDDGGNLHDLPGTSPEFSEVDLDLDVSEPLADEICRTYCVVIEHRIIMPFGVMELVSPAIAMRDDPDRLDAFECHHDTDIGED
jgi:hypothetical protein